MAGFVIERRAERLFIRREFMASKEVEITPDIADILCEAWTQIPDGGIASVYINKMYQRVSMVRRDTQAKREADELADAITKVTGVEDIFSDSQMDNRATYRTMIAYILRLRGYSWTDVVGAVGRNVSTLSRIRPEMFVSSNPESLWMKIKEVRYEQD